LLNIDEQWKPNLSLPGFIALFLFLNYHVRSTTWRRWCECEQRINGKAEEDDDASSRCWRDRRRMKEVNGFYSKVETAGRPNAPSHVEFITFLTDDMITGGFIRRRKKERAQFRNRVFPPGRPLYIYLGKYASYYDCPRVGYIVRLIKSCGRWIVQYSKVLLSRDEIVRKLLNTLRTDDWRTR